MSIIINEFEVVVEQTEASSSQATPAGQEDEESVSSPAELTPEIVEQVNEYLMERRARLWAD